jgi:hypothetical protein
MNTMYELEKAHKGTWIIPGKTENVLIKKDYPQLEMLGQCENKAMILFTFY